MCGHIQQNHRSAPPAQTTRPNAAPHATPKVSDPAGKGHGAHDGFEHPKAVKHHHHHHHHVGQRAPSPTVTAPSPAAKDPVTHAAPVAPKWQGAQEPVIAVPVAKNSDQDAPLLLQSHPLKPGAVKRALG